MLFEIIIVLLSVVFFSMGSVWKIRIKKPTGHNNPLVTIIIPAYNAQNTIEQTLKSVQTINYPRKEVIVISESRDKTPEIASRYGAQVIQNETRQGKPKSLNIATKHAKGEFIFYLDADTLVSKNILHESLPWFNNQDIAAVMPQYRTHNKTNLLTKLNSFDSSYLLSLVRMHMFFGTMIGFRGCAVIMRKSIVKTLGGWRNTLLEDNDMGARIVRAGYKIQYEPHTYVKTIEPDNRPELKRQKMRWSKGSVYAFFHHRRFYMKNPQFLLHNFPYMILEFAFIIYLLVNLFFLNFTIILISIVGVILSLFFHMGLMTWPELDNKKDIVLTIPFTLYYLPLVSYYYFKGFLSGVRGKKERVAELRFEDW